MLTLSDLNAASESALIAMLALAYPGATWIAEGAAAMRPFQSLATLKLALVDVVRAAPREQQEALLQAQAKLPREPDAIDGSAHGQLLLAAYRRRFGWPFVLASGGPRGTGLTASQTLETIERRLQAHRDDEFAEAIRQLHRIAELRLNSVFGTSPELGNLAWDWAERLAQHSDAGYAERGQLTVTYLTDAHRACAQRLAHWMREDCGFDGVDIDAVGNVVGIYHGTNQQTPRLLTGSHYDTVRNAGKYDGRLGIFVPMVCVRELHRARRRLPFSIEVVGFAEEEGQRYRATFLGSGALSGNFDPDWLDQADADGVTMRQAMQHAGLCVDDIPKLARDARDYLGFVEVHIEQGPVLNQLCLPLGVVTSINGGLRYLGEVIGVASHAGTTPMSGRRDAAAAVAELCLFLERRATQEPSLVGTMGCLDVPAGSINVVPGRCRFSLDIRATTDAVRDACGADVRAELARICERRGLHYALEETMCASVAPSAPDLQHRWEMALEHLGLHIHRMPSGAGHDAMKLHELMPQAMLFVRGEHNGISHNPLESTTSDDMQLAIEAFAALLERMARDTSLSQGPSS